MESKNKGRDSEDQLLLDEQQAMLQFNLPTSFGMKEKSRTNSELVNKTKRDASVMPGPKRPGPPAPQRTTPGAPPPISKNIPKESTEEDSMEDEDNNAFVGPPRPTASSAAEDDGQQEEVQMFEDEDDVNFYNIPFSNEIKLTAHTKLISCMALDPSGSRLLTGSYDYTVKMWDWAGMDSSLRNFRSIEPCEGNQLKSIQYTPTGDRFLVATGSSKAKIFDRDGFEKSECVKGDMYLADMANTKGHVASISNACWHPAIKDVFMTASSDSTIRIWDVNKMKTSQRTVVKVKRADGRKTGVTYCAYNRTGSIIAAGCEDGSIQIWDSNGPFSRPKELKRDAHQEGNEISCLCFSEDGYTLVSRSMDDTMKVWDVRNFRQPLAVFTDLPNFGDTDCIFSPDDRLIVTGTSVKKGEGTGLMVFYDKTLLKRVKQIGVAPGGSVISLIWHPKINQIIAGTSEPLARVFFDPKLSINGALLSVSRAVRQKDPNDYEPPRPVINPHSLPMYNETPNAKRKAARAAYDPSRNAKLEPQVSGPGRQGKLGTNLTQYLMKHYIKKDTSRDEDPREALLKYAEETQKNPYFFKIYQETQPNPIWDYSAEPDLVPKPEEKKRKRDDNK